MVQGKFKTKAVMPKGCKQRSQQRIDKGQAKAKNSGQVTKKSKNKVEDIIKKNLENTIKKNIESDLAAQARSTEGGKSFKIVGKNSTPSSK